MLPTLLHKEPYLVQVGSKVSCGVRGLLGGALQLTSAPSCTSCFLDVNRTNVGWGAPCIYFSLPLTFLDTLSSLRLGRLRRNYTAAACLWRGDRSRGRPARRRGLFRPCRLRSSYSLLPRPGRTTPGRSNVRGILYTIQNQLSASFLKALLFVFHYSLISFSIELMIESVLQGLTARPGPGRGSRSC